MNIYLMPFIKTWLLHISLETLVNVLTLLYDEKLI